MCEIPQVADSCGARMPGGESGVSSTVRRSLSIVVLVLATGACQSPPVPGVRVAEPIRPVTGETAGASGTARADVERSAPLLGVNDEIELKFPDNPALNETARVGSDGRISLPLIGFVRAEGLSAEQLQGEVTQRYRALAGDASAESVKEYLIRVGDEIEVKFPYLTQFNDRVTVRPDGRISLQLVGAVTAEGLTAENLDIELKRRYAEFLRAPELTVILRSTTSSRYLVDGREARAGMRDVQPMVIARVTAPLQVFVGGEVGRPGTLAYRRNLTLMQALIESGGVRPSGEMRSVIVLRKSAQSVPLVIRRDLSLDLETAQTQDMPLEPFDVVVLPKTSAAQLAEVLEQNVFNLIPPIKNSAFSFVYGLVPTRVER